MHKSYHSLIKHSENEALFLAVELSILAATSPTPLHLHAEGLRGTGKTSILRAARDILPEIRRVKGCLYNCDPAKPHCPAHRALTPEQLAELGDELVPMPYLEISHSAKVATVVGSIDLSRLTDKDGPEAVLLPGILAQAHRGIVLVDEINRLADTSPEIADVLLDVMGTKPGRLQIEETGLPRVELPIKVTVWAASNPDEDPGPLDGIRRQLSDRFDLSVGVRRPGDVRILTEVLLLSDAPYSGNINHVADERVSLEGKAQSVGLISLPSEVVALVSRLYVDYSLESIRAAESILYAARMHCARRGALVVDKEDIIAGVSLALRHRVSPEVLADILTSLKQKAPPVLSSTNPPQDIRREQIIEPAQRSQGGLLSRLLDAFKEPRDMVQTSGPAGGAHVPEYNQAPLQQRRNVQAAVEGCQAVNPEEIAMMAPRAAARALGEIPFPERIKTEGELF